MRRLLLPAAVLLSIAIAGYLCTGYFARSRIGLMIPRSANRVRTLQFRNGEGRLVLYVEESTNPHPGGPVMVAWQWRPPALRRSLWEFDAHRLQFSGVATTGWIFACPIWCLLLACLVLPIAWWISRRRPEPRGFAVGFLQDVTPPLRKPRT